MKSKILAVLLSCLILTTGSACHTIEIVEPLPCPARPTLVAVSPELQQQAPEELIQIVSDNQLKLKAYAKKLEVRASCEVDK